MTLLIASACTTYYPGGRGGAQAGLSGPFHRVERGETLSRIADRYGVPWRQIATVNDIDRPYTIYSGQALRIPEGRTPVPRATSADTAIAAARDAASPRARSAASVRRTAAPRPETVAAAPAELAQPTQDEDGVHVVRSGETLYSISRGMGLPMKELAALNDVAPPYELQVGQRLNVPSVVPTPAQKPGAAFAAVPKLSGEGFVWPVSGKIIGRFGASDDGLKRDGINIAARRGAPVRAAEDGVVAYADEGIRGYGRMILLRHDDDYITTYAHNAALLVDVGDLVARGQIIARVGDSGGVDQAQLHFEIRKGLQAIDPERLLVQQTTEVASSD